MARRCVLAIALVAIGCGDAKRDTPAPGLPARKRGAPAAVTSVTIAGTVIDQTTGNPVGDVDVVVRGDGGEQTARANAGGEFSLRAPPGTYHVYVRGDRVIATGLAERVRLDTAPRGELVGVADLALIPALDATSDVRGLELTVAPAAEVSGVVRDPDDREVVNAIVRLRSTDRLFAARPVLGTDVAVTDANGRFALRVPPGAYEVDIAHPSFAGVRAGDDELELHAGSEEIVVPVVRGCIVSGRVVNADGSPANDGAIEKLGPRTGGFGPAGRIDAGAFRWTTTFDEEVTLRAWPWHSAPSPGKTFACSDGRRFSDVVLRIPDQRPDIAGTIVDAADRPVPLAHLDIQPLDQIVGGQQERADAAGSWHVYDMPPGRYRITASAPGLGIVDTMVVAPRQDLRLQLGGTGRIAGTTTELVTGSLEVSFLHCGAKDQPLLVAHEPRIVPVVGGRFAIDNAPACTLTLAVRWRNKLTEVSAVVEPGRTAYIEIEAGTPREKTVTGIVRDATGKAVAGASVTAVLHDREAATARTDDSGRFTLHTYAGAQLVAGRGGRAGRARVGRANVASEQVDIVLDDRGF
jgi:hypothetical protein